MEDAKKGYTLAKDIEDYRGNKTRVVIAHFSQDTDDVEMTDNVDNIDDKV